MTDTPNPPYDQDDDDRGGTEYAGEHPDEPDVDEQPNPDAEPDDDEAG